eukprot:TRINITY_DN14234_c0_g2_i1.p1 TRINITY_DN14234_c0_g2~~TRINITY_DN14234_c0_g2_i1.p1  ORF type:complete len:155 (+),score=19.12 TRINITY_DN14234_c0_g2_i1:196-660(+)
MAIPMREDFESLMVFKGLLEKERSQACRWKKQSDYKAWLDPRMSHHDGILKPGERCRLGFSRSHPELNGALTEVISIDSKGEGGLITVKVGTASGRPKKMKVRPELLLPGRGAAGATLRGVAVPEPHGPTSSNWRQSSSSALLASAQSTLRSSH